MFWRVLGSSFCVMQRPPTLLRCGGRGSVEVHPISWMASLTSRVTRRRALLRPVPPAEAVGSWLAEDGSSDQSARFGSFADFRQNADGMREAAVESIAFGVPAYRNPDDGLANGSAHGEGGVDASAAGGGADGGAEADGGMVGWEEEDEDGDDEEDDIVDVHMTVKIVAFIRRMYANVREDPGRHARSRVCDPDRSKLDQF